MLKDSKYCFNATVLKTFLVLILLTNIYKVNTDCDIEYPWYCDNGDCIDEDLLCDGEVNCGDGSDETSENCIHRRKDCPAYAFTCAYGGCIAGKFKCNGIKNCADNSDEMPQLCDKDTERFERQLQGNCTDNNYMQCRSGECIEHENRCDGRIDCEDGSDEIVDICSTTYCPSYAFRCGYGGCISGNAKCNGVKDCPDGSDEAAQLCGRPRISMANANFTTTSTTTTRRPTSGAGNYCQIPRDRQNLITEEFGGAQQKRRYQPGDQVLVDKIVRFSCEHKFNLEGREHNFCKGNQWNEPVPRCIRYCSKRELTRGFSTEAVCYYDDTQVKCNDEIRPGTEARISCATGFIRPSRGIFRSVLKCTEQSKWDFPKPSCDLDCGRVTPRTTAFVKGGVNVNITDVPWHVGIYAIFNTVSYSHICGGTIVSPRVVLSAAHCFWDVANSKLYNVSLFKTVAGKYFRDYYSKEEFFPTQSRNISEILVSEYKGVEDNYRNDVAILILATHFRFTHSILPICLTFYERAQTQVESNVWGTVVGWGVSDDEHPSEVLKSVTMKTLSYGDCKAQLDAKHWTTYRLPDDKFCLVDNDSGSSVCRGDSGGGYFIKGADYIYRLVGIVSHAPVSVRDCGRDGIVTLTNIQYFQDFARPYLYRELAKDFDDDVR